MFSSVSFADKQRSKHFTTFAKVFLLRTLFFCLYFLWIIIFIICLVANFLHQAQTWVGCCVLWVLRYYRSHSFQTSKKHSKTMFIWICFVSFYFIILLLSCLRCDAIRVRPQICYWNRRQNEQMRRRETDTQLTTIVEKPTWTTEFSFFEKLHFVFAIMMFNVVAQWLNCTQFGCSKSNYALCSLVCRLNEKKHAISIDIVTRCVDLRVLLRMSTCMPAIKFRQKK